MPNYSGMWTRQAQLQAIAVPNWPSAPGAPTSVTAAVAGATSVTVTFTAPTNTGIPPGITGYRVTSTPGGITATGASSPITVTGLTTGQEYTFTVAAQNASGYGPESAASNPVTPQVFNYIEDVFSTWLYTGNASTQSITNGINLSANGGMVWIKARNVSLSNYLFNTVAGAGAYMRSDATSPQITDVARLSAFNSDGFSLGSNAGSNGLSNLYSSWTFREQPKFFDIVTWTGNGVNGRAIPHNLGSVPGCIIVKCTSTDTFWTVYHRSIPVTSSLYLNDTGGTVADNYFGTTPTSTDFYVRAAPGNGTNQNGFTYVAYVFAHNAGGFGSVGTDNVISCGSFSGTGSNVTVSLGYEPQWVLMKRTDGASDWQILDTMRMWKAYTTSAYSSNTALKLAPNSSTSETGPYNLGEITSTGFFLPSTVVGSGENWVYVAIRRPMKTPIAGTSVFSPNLMTSDVNPTTVGFAPDAFIWNNYGYAYTPVFSSRITTPNCMMSSSNLAEGTFSSNSNIVFQSNTAITPYLVGGMNGVCWTFRRATSFFDVVNYVGTGVAQNITHNLGVVPQLMIIKRRSGGNTAGITYSPLLTTNKIMELFSNFGANPAISEASIINTDPTATTFNVRTDVTVNAAGSTYIAYLFATCENVSKVGVYTGNGSSQTINCGFTGGSRFVMIKRTDSSGDWYVWDSARGIVAGNDSHISLNNTNLPVTTDDSVDTDNTGFIVNQNGSTSINSSSGIYLYLAIA